MPAVANGDLFRYLAAIAHGVIGGGEASTIGGCRRQAILETKPV